MDKDVCNHRSSGATLFRQTNEISLKRTSKRSNKQSQNNPVLMSKLVGPNPTNLSSNCVQTPSSVPQLSSDDSCLTHVSPLHSDNSSDVVTKSLLELSNNKSDSITNPHDTKSQDDKIPKAKIIGFLLFGRNPNDYDCPHELEINDDDVEENIQSPKKSDENIIMSTTNTSMNEDLSPPPKSLTADCSAEHVPLPGVTSFVLNPHPNMTWKKPSSSSTQKSLIRVGDAAPKPKATTKKSSHATRNPVAIASKAFAKSCQTVKNQSLTKNYLKQPKLPFKANDEVIPIDEFSETSSSEKKSHNPQFNDTHMDIDSHVEIDAHVSDNIDAHVVIDAGSPVIDAPLDIDALCLVGSPVIDAGSPVIDAGSPVIDAPLDIDAHRLAPVIDALRLVGSPVIDAGPPVIDAPLDIDARRLVGSPVIDALRLVGSPVDVRPVDTSVVLSNDPKNKEEIKVVDPFLCPFKNCLKIFSKSQHLESHLQTHKGFTPSKDWLQSTNRTLCEKCNKVVQKTAVNMILNKFYHRKCRPLVDTLQNRLSFQKPTLVRELIISPNIESSSSIQDIPSFDEIFKISVPTRNFIPAKAAQDVSKSLIKLIDEVILKNDKLSWTIFFCFWKCILNPFTPNPNISFSDLVLERCKLFEDGNNWIKSWSDVISFSKECSNSRGNLDWKKSVIKRVENGNISSGFKALLSKPMIAFNQEIFDKLKNLHPSVEDFKATPSSIVPPPPSTTPLDLNFNIDKLIRSFPLGTAPGPDGLRVQHLRDLIRLCVHGSPNDPRPKLIKFINFIASGKPNLIIGPYFSSARLIALPKKDDGIRPIAVGNVWRRLISKAVLIPFIEQAKKSIEPHQLGVGVRGGAEKISHAIRVITSMYKNDSDFGILQLDFKNAFNKVSRAKIIEIVKNNYPKFYHFVSLCYCHSPFLFINNWETPIRSENGVQQGDPLGPLLFSLVANVLIKKIQDNFPDVLNFWYLDDGHLIGNIDKLSQILDFVNCHSNSLGLFLNLEKSKIFNPTLSDKISKIFPPEIIKTSEGIECLGVPIGSPNFVQKELLKKLEKNSKSNKKNPKLDDPQISIMLHYHCLRLSTINYYLRCSHPEETIT